MELIIVRKEREELLFVFCHKAIIYLLIRKIFMMSIFLEIEMKIRNIYLFSSL